MYQFFSRPDRHWGRCGHLDCALVEREISPAPAFLSGLRALFITDTHITARTTQADLSAFVDRIAAIPADIILWGGDFADHAAHALRLFRSLAGLKPALGSFAVKGNNDSEAWPDTHELRSALRASGIRLLVNESVRIPVGGGTLILAGIDEPHLGHPEPRGLYPEAASGDQFRLLLSHYPVLPKRPPELMLSGHTHGGQFNLLGITPYTIGFERILHPSQASQFISGYHDLGHARVLVSKGIGASRIPLRIGVKPEIELMVFKA